MRKDMRVCKTCGQMIAKNAKNCPNCGARKRISFFGVFIALLIAVVVFLIAGMAMAFYFEDRENARKQEALTRTEENIIRQEQQDGAHEPDRPDETENDTESISETQTEDSETEEKPAETATETELIDGMRPEFKEAMDSYEAYFEEYCDLLVAMKDNPSDPTLLMEYTSFLSSYEETMKEFEALEDEEMNDAELLYYIEVTGRIQSMLAEASIG